MIANPRFDAGRFRPPADDAVGVLLEEGIGCKLPGLAAGGEEIAVDVIGDAGRFDIIVQTLIETMMTGNVVLLTALVLNLKNGSSTVLKIAFDLQIYDRADPAASTSVASSALSRRSMTFQVSIGSISRSTTGKPAFSPSLR